MCAHVPTMNIRKMVWKKIYIYILLPETIYTIRSSHFLVEYIIGSIQGVSVIRPQTPRGDSFVPTMKKDRKGAGSIL